MYAPSINALQRALEADSFETLADVAIENLCEQVAFQKGEPCCMVCGPMTTGGTGNQAMNFSIITAAIHALGKRGFHVFNQVPYEEALHRLVREWKKDPKNTGYCRLILEVFYRNIFATRKINHGFFIPRWESSTGTLFEHDELPVHGALVTEFNEETIRGFLLEDGHPFEHVEKVIRLLPNDSIVIRIA